MPVLETATEIVCTVYIKNLPYNNHSAVDKPMIGFPQMELVDEWCKTRETKNISNSRALDTGNRNKKNPCGSNPESFEFLDTLTFVNENRAKKIWHWVSKSFKHQVENPARPLRGQ